MGTRFLAAAASLAVLVSVSAANAASFGTNLVANGDAEAGSATAFTTTGDFTVLPYTYGGGYPVAGDPGVSEGGEYFFAGSMYVGLSTASQTIDLSSLASAIDSGGTGYTLSALLGGFASQDDNSVLSIAFRGLGGVDLGDVAIGPVTPADRNDQTGFLNRSDSGFVPVGTRSVDLLLTATRYEGTSNDGYADNLSFVLSAPGAVSGAPEPGTWALMLGGVGMLGGMLRAHARRRRDEVPV